MHIFIDESGGFIIPAVKKPKVSCVAALVLPSSKRAQIVAGFLKIRSSWGVEGDEIKGSRLSESQIAEVLTFLSNYDVIVEVCAIDTGSHTEQQIKDYQKGQADKITENLTPIHHPDVIQEVQQLKDNYSRLSPQLAPQFTATIQLITRLLETVTLYYSQRLPQELGHFNWIVDAKDTKVTNYEELWTTLILPMSVQMGPLLIFDQGDYSYFDRFNKTLDKTPDYLDHIIDDPEAPFEGTDFSMIMRESFTFGNSRQEAGLQLVDIVASAFSRAMNQSLKQEGWQGLGALFVNRNKDTVRMIGLNPDPKLIGRSIHERNYFGYVVEEIEKRAKPMLVPLKALAKLKRANRASNIHKNKIGRGAPCPCQSGKTYSKCCGRQSGKV
jgi:hypothetical protein